MSDTDRTEDVLNLIEHYTDIGLRPDSSAWDTFAYVLYEIGVTALAEEDEDGEPSPDTVTALHTISTAFAHVQQVDAE